MSPEGIPQDLVLCSICMAVPLVPWCLAPCEHLVCKDCVHDGLAALQQNKENDDESFRCPVDQKVITKDEIHPLQKGTFAHRAWSSVMIRCDKVHSGGCDWTGSIASFRLHKEKGECKSDKRPFAAMIRSKSEKPLTTIETRRRKEESVLSGGGYAGNNNEGIVPMLESEDTVLSPNVKNFAASSSNAKKNNNASSINKKNSVPVSCILGGYVYNKATVVKLAQLICANLDEKPTGLSRNKIFERVKKIYTHFHIKKGCCEDPAGSMGRAVCMLLAVSSASNWFSGAQGENFGKWRKDQGW